MFYIASVITFGIFLELPWKSTLLVFCKLNIFWHPQVNQFDIIALIFGGYARFTPLDKMVYIDNGNLNLGSLSILKLALIFVSVV